MSRRDVCLYVMSIKYEQSSYSRDTTNFGELKSESGIEQMVYTTGEMIVIASKRLFGHQLASDFFFSDLFVLSTRSKRSARGKVYHSLLEIVTKSFKSKQ